MSEFQAGDRVIDKLYRRRGTVIMAPAAGPWVYVEFNSAHGTSFIHSDQLDRYDADADADADAEWEALLHAIDA